MKSLSILLINSFILLLFCGNLSATDIIETEGEQAGFHEKAFKKRLISLTHDGATVYFKFKEAGLGFVADSESGFEFNLKQGQLFSTAPDHHGATQYILEEIGPDGITLRYEARFDHRSFGPDKITIDRGTFKLPYISPPP